jgi:thioredoxin reductase
VSIEVVIVGGGPAGLSAALVLGRCRRRVLVFDDGHHRNDEASAVNGYLTRDGVAPAELRRLARAELARYPSVELRDDTIASITRDRDSLVATTASGERIACARVLLATGAVDVRPTIAGVDALHGRLVVPCPYCDGWEHRERRLAAISHPDERGARFAIALTQWSSDVVLFTSGPARLSRAERAQLAHLGIALDERSIVRIDEIDGELRLMMSDAQQLRRDVVFYHLGCRPAGPLAQQLDLRLDGRGSIAVDRHGGTSVPGVYAAGDATRDTLQAIVGAGEGASAAIAIDRSLTATLWHPRTP